tara:strand:+ start:391 stop:543 length:153 start_codon:yes stop_codon:yes gene_type:complete
MTIPTISRLRKSLKTQKRISKKDMEEIKNSFKKHIQVEQVVDAEDVAVER